METNLDQANENPRSSTAAKRFLRIFFGCVVTIAVIVATINLVAYRYMSRAENQSIVQLLSGWGRMYKPILYDAIKPEIAVFGASWARDAFDPTTTGQLLGRTVFNHGVSGSEQYETRRFADAALDNPNLQVAIVNLNSFFRDKNRARFRYGFDESILDVDAEHRPNHFVSLRRAYSLALGGWSVGANIKLISTIMARDRGVAKPDYLESYEQGDLTQRHLAPFRERMFPSTGPTQNFTPSGTIPALPQYELDEFDILIDGFCNNGVDIYAYFTPSHVRQQSCDIYAGEERAALEFLRRKQTSCSANIRYYHFAYPNAMTLEGVLAPVTASRYYRPDGHPRPTVGLVMAARMFDQPFPAETPLVLQQDFGVDLLSHADAEGWLLKRAARCQGNWDRQVYDELMTVLQNP